MGKKNSQNLVPFQFRRMRNEPPSRLAQPSQKTMAGHVPLVSETRGAKRTTAGEAPWTVRTWHVFRFVRPRDSITYSVPN